MPPTGPADIAPAPDPGDDAPAKEPPLLDVDDPEAPAANPTLFEMDDFPEEPVFTSATPRVPDVSEADDLFAPRKTNAPTVTDIEF